jgi:hypothetical protein
MAGLVPAIRVVVVARKKDVDARDICAKTRFALLRGHDEQLLWVGCSDSPRFFICDSPARRKSGLPDLRIPDAQPG